MLTMANRTKRIQQQYLVGARVVRDRDVHDVAPPRPRGEASSDSEPREALVARGGVGVQEDDVRTAQRDDAPRNAVKLYDLKAQRSINGAARRRTEHAEQSPSAGRQSSITRELNDGDVRTPRSA